MIRAQIMTTWTGDGLTTQTARRPKISDDFVLAFCTNQPSDQPGTMIIPDPNVVIVEVICTPDVYEAIYEHVDYGPGAIQWSRLEGGAAPKRRLMPENGIPDANEYGKSRSFCAQNGISQAQFEELYGGPGNKKTRGAGARNVAAWAHGLPKDKKKVKP